MNCQPILTAAAAVTAFVTGLCAQAADSTFGHARTRELAELGVLPRPIDVAVADIVNFHHHRLPMPRAGDAVAMDLRFDRGEQSGIEPLILQLGFTTAPPGDRVDLPPLQLVLVLDCSGSMQAAGKMDALKRALRAFFGQLRSQDRVALVTYSDEAHLAQASRAFGDGRWLQHAVDELTPGGATNLHAGLLRGLDEAAANQLAHGSNRVLLLTDGIANRGETSPDAILRDAKQRCGDGIDLSTIGLGRDLDTGLLDRLARGNRGLFHFAADPADIEKVFVREAAALMSPVARRVELTVELPTGLRLERVIGHAATTTDTGFVLGLPDMNRGLTAVVLAVVHRTRAGAGDGEPLVQARLRFLDAASGREATVRGTAEVPSKRTSHAGAAARDPEVTKNFAIARLAEGMRTMAEHAEQKRWGEADRALRAALREAGELFPSAQDPDLRAVLQMAEGHQRTLARHTDRFRDY